MVDEGHQLTLFLETGARTDESQLPAGVPKSATVLPFVKRGPNIAQLSNESSRDDLLLKVLSKSLLFREL